jgi:hypothetical protein
MVKGWDGDALSLSLSPLSLNGHPQWSLRNTRLIMAAP